MTTSEIDLTPYQQYAKDVIEEKIVACKYVRQACERYLSFFDKYEFRPKKVDKVVNFIRHLKHFTGKFNGKNFELLPYQYWIVCAIFGFYYPNTDKRVTNYVYIELARKSGKALSVDTPIPTPNGYTTMGDLQVGDYVFDETGQPTQVTYVTPIMYGHKCYEVTFSDGEVITCDADHNWYVDRYHKNKYHVETTQEIIDKGYYNNRKNGYKERYISIPTAKSLQYEEQELPIDPYTFGVWLGDGSKASAVLTLNGDDCDEILSYIPYKPKLVKKYKDENAYCVKLTGDYGKPSEFSQFLIDYKLREGKYIPNEFLYNSIENRMSLLQGIMDSDGYVNKNKNGSVNCEIQQKNNSIADGICFLLSSFGIKYKRSKKTPKLNGRQCDEVNRISFNVDKRTPVFRLKRKYNLLRDIKGKKDVKHIKEIKQVESVPVKCITVDSPNHLYLCGKRNTVTHNTAFAAALALYMMVADGENGAECEMVANSRKQAKICFDLASNLLSSIDLKGKHFKRYRDTIKFEQTKSFTQILSSDASGNDGYNSSCFILDECHEQPDSRLWDVMCSSQGMRQNPLGIIITTAGFNLFSFCYDYRRTCTEILAQTKEDDSQFAAIYTLDDDDDWTDENVWIKSNPSLDVTVTKDFIRQQINKAKNNSGLEVGIRTKNLNQWLSTSAIWITNDLLLDSTQKIDLKDFEGETCYMGVDLASVSDMTALATLVQKDDKYYFKVNYYLPQATLTGNANSELYKQWYRQGFLTVTSGNVTDYDYLLSDILKINNYLYINYISYDQYNATQWAINATAEGLPLEPYSQALWNFNRPTKEFERLIKSGKVVIDNNPITRWCFSNVVLKHDSNENVKPVKMADMAKIDGVVAMLEALGKMLEQPQYNNIVTAV